MQLAGIGQRLFCQKASQHYKFSYTDISSGPSFLYIAVTLQLPSTSLINEALIKQSLSHQATPTDTPEALGMRNCLASSD